LVVKQLSNEEEILMTLILDAMGSDTYPEPEIEGAINAARDFGEEIVLVGKEEMLRPKLEAARVGDLPLRIVHAPDVLEMTDKPVEGTRKKPLNSMAVGLGMVKRGEGRVFVTAGNTGGACFNALKTLGRLKGVDRAPLAPILPTKSGRCVLVDSGANVDCRPEFLLQFAVLASIYARLILKLDNPRVGLLSNGEEEEKGNELVKAAHTLLAANPHINFVGNVEPKEVFQSNVDVVVADGFAGNVFIKSSEAVADLLLGVVKESIESKFVWKLGGLLARPAFRKVRKMLNPEDIGGALLLGVDGLILIGHGRSNARAIYSALGFAQQCANLNLLETMRGTVQAALSEA
jgi:glycerol-3-phosphate acyltransferase PlsX